MRARVSHAAPGPGPAGARAERPERAGERHAGGDDEREAGRSSGCAAAGAERLAADQRGGTRAGKPAERAAHERDQQGFGEQQ